MNKEKIIEEIQRMAKNNGNVPLGLQRFVKETGINEHEIVGKYWARWGDAVAEAGLAPNKITAAYGESDLFGRYIALSRRLGHLPTPADLLLETRNDPMFPHEATYRARFGPKPLLVDRLEKHCRQKVGFEDIVQLCQAYSSKRKETESDYDGDGVKAGFVYMIKHGSRSHFKIGKTFNPVRREGEIAIQLPEKVRPVHYIETDDPSGIEAYWHSRFASKRKEGEWFELSSSDVNAFKKWKRIF